MRLYQVPCHACGHAQALIWANVRWDKTPDGKHLPATAHYVCESCGAIWTDTDRHDAVAKGKWVATNPDVVGVTGFHITGPLSPWVALVDIVQEFLMSKNDAALLQVWTNTCLGDPFEPAQETVEGSLLSRRGENYGPQSIPDAVKLLTAGVDVQGDRIEVQIMGFSPVTVEKQSGTAIRRRTVDLAPQPYVVHDHRRSPQRTIKISHRLLHRVGREPLAKARVRRCSHTGSQGFIVGQPDERKRRRVDIAGRHQDALDAVADDLAATDGIGGHDRPSRRGRLHECPRHPLPIGGEKQCDVMIPPDARHIAGMAAPSDARHGGPPL